MNKLKLFKSSVVGIFLVFSNLSFASFITANGVSVNALNLDGVVTSFEEMYSYHTPNTFSSNTGFEQPDQIVLFAASLNNELALFTTVSGRGGKAGGLTMTVSGSEGSVTFVDDPIETSASGSFAFSYGRGKSDGIIFSDFTTDDWTVDFDFLTALNIAGFSFLTFDNNGNASTALSQAGLPSSLSVSASSPASLIPAPGTLLLLSLGLIALFRLRATN